MSSGSLPGHPVHQGPHSCPHALLYFPQSTDHYLKVYYFFILPPHLEDKPRDDHLVLVGAPVPRTMPSVVQRQQVLFECPFSGRGRCGLLGVTGEEPGVPTPWLS